MLQQFLPQKAPAVEVHVRFGGIKEKNWCAGECVPAKVIFTCKDSVRVASLKVFLVGREDYHKPQGRVISNSLVSHTPIVIAEKKSYEAGEYTFPLEISLPSELQPSVYSPGNFLTAYAIQVELRISGSSKIVINHFDLYIHRPAAVQLARTFNEKTTKGLIHKESLIFKCLPSSQVLQLWEPLELDIILQNKTRKQISRMLIGLEQVIMRGKNKKTDDEPSYVFQVAEKMKLEPLESFQKTLPFNVQKQKGVRIPATYEGILIRVNYFLVFTFELDAGGEWIFRIPITVRSAYFPTKIAEQITTKPIAEVAPVDEPIRPTEPIETKDEEPSPDVHYHEAELYPIPEPTISYRKTCANNVDHDPPSYSSLDEMVETDEDELHSF